MNSLIVILLTWISYINKQYIQFIKHLSYFFTVKYDLFNYSNRIIKFPGNNNFYGFKVTFSTTQYNKRMISWFYAYNTIPSYSDWLYCVHSCGLKEIPEHVMQLYDLNIKPTNNFIIVNGITSNVITYTYVNKSALLEVVELPTNIMTLSPSRMVKNITSSN